MVTLVSAGTTNEYIGKTLDDKPTVHVPNGSTFLEMDSTTLYIFDAESQEWVEQ